MADVTISQIGSGTTIADGDLIEIERPGSPAVSEHAPLGSAAGQSASAFATAAQGELADTAVQPGDLAAVATSGDYDDLSNKPTLGTAAASDIGDFATAAQGTKADTALQPAAIGTTVAAQNDSRFETVPDGYVTPAKMNSGDAVSVLGRSANSSGTRADIAASANDRLLARVSNALSFVQLTAGMIANGIISFAHLASGAIASQGEAEAGAASNKLMTPQRTAQAIAALGGGGGGWDPSTQTWQSPSRNANNTAYRNTTGQPIFVSMSINWAGANQNAPQVSANNSTWFDVGTNITNSRTNSGFVVPHNYYYRVHCGASGGVLAWTELR